MNLHDLITALLGLSVIALGVVGVWLFGRDAAADEHTVADYGQPAPESFSFPLASRGLSQMREDLRRQDEPEDILPPAPPGMNAGSPLYAGMLFDTWYPEDPAEVAERWLREIGAEEQDKAGIGPAHDHWVNWDGTCDLGCPGCARDMTGSFPVVRAAA